jgi:arylsulfatase A-like enzyme
MKDPERVPRKEVDRRTFMKQTAATITALSLAPEDFFGQDSKKNSRHPNLLIVFPDQMRAQAQGFMNEDPVFTPTLDKFAKESVVFTQAVSNYPLCSPYRGSLMTGQYPHAHGVIGNCNDQGTKYGVELKTDARCWSDILKENGYSLGYIGKWHLDSPRKPYVKCYNNTEKEAWNEWTTPNRRHGFDFWYAYGTYDQHMNPMYWDTKAGRDEAHWVNAWGPEHEADQAIRFLKNEDGKFRDPKKPFALVVSMNPPHMPYDQVPQKYLDLYKDKPLDELTRRSNVPPAGTRWGDYYRKNIKGYLAMTTGVDEQFGRILLTLKDLGLEKDTIVLFTSDHGNCLGIHDQISKNIYYEESMRIPFLIRWPGRIKPRREDLLLSTPNIYPTLLDMMGLSTAIPKTVEGASHARLILTGGGSRPTSQLYLEIPYGQPAWGRRGIRTYRYTLAFNKAQGKPVEPVLHDNIIDPFQLKNIAPDNPGLVQKLQEEELFPWLKKTRDPWR